MLRIVIAILLIVLPAVAAHAERRVALVIGADRYKAIRKLDNAVDDAQAVADMLEKLGFEVTLETDRDLRRTRRALEDFREDGENADVALVYFAGHGVEIAGRNRLLPVDADASSLEALKGSTLPLEEVRETVSTISKVGLIMLDACRNDPFGTGSGGGGSGGDDPGRSAVPLASDVVSKAKPGLGRLGRAEGILFAFSAAPGETASDGADGHSPFATALIKYLGADGLEVRSALTLVQQEVYDLSRGRQLPYVESGLPTLFFASASKDRLPERERLLLAMADVTPDLRTEVEALASHNDMPLAPLYAALISSDAKELSQEERSRKLSEAAAAFVATRTQIRTLASTDPAVTRLREEAEAQLSLGAFDAARGKLAEAATIDSASRDALKANFVERTLSEATTHMISGGTSRADLNYELAIASYERAAALYEEVSREAVPEEQRRQQLTALETLGDLYVTTGDLASALQSFGKGRELAETMARAEPSNPVWKFALATGYLKVGDVVRDQGNSQGALAAYRNGLGVYGDLSSRTPRELGLAASAYLKIGYIEKMQGEADQALASYQASRDIAAGLVAADPDREEWQATLARGYRLIGEIQQETGRLPEAVASFQASLDIARRLAEARPDDTLRQFDLAAAHDGMGSVRYAQAREIARTRYVESGGQEAIASYDASIAISRRLIAADPRNTAWQSGLAGTLERKGEAIFWGDNNITSEDADNSLAAYKEATEIRERLVQSDPTNKVWLASLVTSYEKRATWYEFQSDDVSALEFTKKAHQASLDLAALDPQNMDWQRKATLYHAKIAESYVQLKDYKSALDYEMAGLEYAVKIAKANPDKAVYYNDVTTFDQRIARLYWIQKDMNNYWAQNDFTLEQAKRNEQRFPDDPDTLRNLYQAYMDVAKSWTKNDPKKALEYFNNARAAVERAASLDAGNPSFRYSIYETYINTGYMHEEHGEQAEALKAYQNARETIEKAVMMKPDEAMYKTSLKHADARIANIFAQGYQPNR